MSATVGEILFLVVLTIAWLAIPVGVPGTLVMLIASLLYAWVSGFRELDGQDLLWIAGIALPAEGADQLLGIWAARRYGGTLKGVFGSVAGGLLGSVLLGPLFPIIGTVIGAILGAFAGTYVVERVVQKDARLALRAAWGGFLGRTAGIILKMVAGGWIIYLAADAVLG
jgi:uncharacterized protein YqgC (DUF456 family)